jgi:hypothetical protein
MIIAAEKFKAESVERINHIQDLCKKHKPPLLTKKQFVDEVGSVTQISRPTLEKVYDGATKLDYDVIEKLAWFFGVGIEDVLESRF